MCVVYVLCEDVCMSVDFVGVVLCVCGTAYGDGFVCFGCVDLYIKLCCGVQHTVYVGRETTKEKSQYIECECW